MLAQTELDYIADGEKGYCFDHPAVIAETHIQVVDRATKQLLVALQANGFELNGNILKRGNGWLQYDAAKWQYSNDAGATWQDIGGQIAYSTLSGLPILDSLTPCGRLTLTTGVPVATADVTAATTLYYAPFEGNRLPLYNGSAWVVSTFTELSLSLSGATADKNNDIFVYDNGGTLTLEKVEWTNGTTRATAIAYQDGVAVKSGATGRRYLGTIRTTAMTGQCEDSAAKRYVWNCYHRRERLLSYTDATTSWTYASQTWRQLRGQSSAQISCIIGIAEDITCIDFGIFSLNAYIGIGINSTSTPSAASKSAGTANYGNGVLSFPVILPVGFSGIYPLESALTGGTGEYYGGSTMFFQARVS